MILNLCCIIEGHGEEEAVPVLVRRIQQNLRPDIQLAELAHSRPACACRNVRHEAGTRTIRFLRQMLARNRTAARTSRQRLEETA